MQTSQKVVLSVISAKLKAMKSGSARNSRHCTLMINGRWPMIKLCAFGAFQTRTKVHHVVIFENVVLMAASQIITVCITHFDNHRIPLQLQTTPPDFCLLFKKIQLFQMPQELQPFQPFRRKVSEWQLACPWRGRARFSGLTQQPYWSTLPQNWFL